MAVEPLEEGARGLEVIARARELTDRARAVDGVEQPLLARVDRQVDVAVGVVRLISTAAAPGEPLLDAIVSGIRIGT